MIFRTFLVILGVDLTVCSIFGQSSQEFVFEKVFSENKINKSYEFDFSTKSTFLKTKIKYLGLITTAKGREFKLLTYKLIWGPNRHTTGIIYVFNMKNRFVGQYHLGGACDLPKKLEDGNLIFKPNNSQCGCDEQTSINLRKRLPLNIFIKCHDGHGDVYPISYNR